jgi:hypothetical protein
MPFSVHTTALAVTLALTLSVPAPAAVAALRWGSVGHRIVGDIAESRLSPAVDAETRRLLGGQGLGDVASWADEQRGELGPSVSPWHYVDIEVMDSSYVASRDCKRDACVVAALQAQLAILGDRRQADSARGIALRWVIHLVGDLHQPLHAGERGDRGGNDVKVTFDGRHTNLHSVWDSGIIASLDQPEPEMVQQLEGEIGRRHDIDAIAGGTVVQWVMQSHDLARDVVYGNLPPTLDITPAYVTAAVPVIREQLLRAGVRLAALLERTLRG